MLDEIERHILDHEVTKINQPGNLNEFQRFEQFIYQKKIQFVEFESQKHSTDDIMKLIQYFMCCIEEFSIEVYKEEISAKRDAVIQETNKSVCSKTMLEVFAIPIIPITILKFLVPKDVFIIMFQPSNYVRSEFDQCCRNFPHNIPLLLSRVSIHSRTFGVMGF